MKNSFKNIKDVPAIENYYIMIYLYKSCDHWNERCLRNYKSDNGYRLHQANHIDVEVGRVPDTTYRFINIQFLMYCNLHVFVFFPAVCTIKTGMTMPKKRAKSCDLGRF